MDPREEDPPQPSVQNHIADQHGSSVQAGIVHGGVHVHPGESAPRGRLIWVISGVVILVVGGLVGTFVALNRTTGDAVPSGSPADSGPPVSVVVQDDTNPGFQPAVFAFAAPLSPAPDSIQAGQQVADIVHEHDGVQAGRLQLTLVLTGHRAQPVTVTGLRAVIGKREPTLRGSELIMSSQGDVAAVDTCIGLGSGDEITRVFDPNANVNTCAAGNPSFFTGHFISLAKGESIVVNCMIDAAADGYFEFDLMMTIVANDVSAEIPITENGRPLRLTSYATDPEQVYITRDQPTVLQRIDPASLNSGGNG